MRYPAVLQTSELHASRVCVVCVCVCVCVRGVSGLGFLGLGFMGSGFRA